MGNFMRNGEVDRKASGRAHHPQENAYLAALETLSGYKKGVS